MQISITNYRNINQLGIEFEEGKVNYLFGVCGSGKSSILDAISKPLEAKDATVGEASEPVVLVDGNPPQPAVASLYSIERHTILFDQAANEDCYRVFVGDESELLEHEAAFHASIENLREIRQRLIAMKDDVDALAKEIGKPAARSGKFSGSTRLCKAHVAVSGTTGRVRGMLDACDYDYLEWQSRGFTVNDDFDNDVCPFCGQEIPEDRAIKLSEVRALTTKELKPIFTASPIMERLGFQAPDFSGEVEFAKLKERLERLFTARVQIELVLQYCNIGNGTALLKGIPRGLELDEAVYEFVPELRAIAEDVNARRAELSSLMGRMAADLKRMVDTNARSLNSKLKTLGIPYAFEIEDADRSGHKAAYVLRHVRGKQGADMRKQLSYGEKNLIALLLFLHNNDSELTLVDDPASSYDDFRRSQIYRCIMEHQGKTVLVVSHDQAFVRRAACDRDSGKLGKIQFLENAGHGCKVHPITRSSFIFIDEEIKRRIGMAADYFQKMVNVRLYCDIHRHEVSEAVWGYTSAVLHGEDRDKIASLLSEAGVDEQSVLVELSANLGMELPAMPETVDRTVKSSFTDYEALVAAREGLRRKREGSSLPEEGSLQLDMLNDLVHMNDCALFCLNPYEYAVWPPVFASLLEEVRKS
ncbi:hypothetical protein [Olsenella urininfantis]|uniref:hypothetical protein n=1 Tax=Olsenella urininfantis TaxID=1871033 RepID=UPI000987229B|nr:hypothetical protein [Olsenella urininfantis]